MCVVLAAHVQVAYVVIYSELCTVTNRQNYDPIHLSCHLNAIIAMPLLAAMRLRGTP